MDKEGDYDTAWKSIGTGRLAYDLSAVPTERREQVVLAWYTSPDDQFGASSRCYSTGDDFTRPYLRKYAIEVDKVPTGGMPQSGWVKVVKVAEGRTCSDQHLVNLAGYNWIRVKRRGPNGILINVNMADPSGADNGWLFLGASLTDDYAGHPLRTAPVEAGAAYYDLLISHKRVGALTGARSLKPAATDVGLTAREPVRKSWHTLIWRVQRPWTVLLVPTANAADPASSGNAAKVRTETSSGRSAGERTDWLLIVREA